MAPHPIAHILLASVVARLQTRDDNDNKGEIDDKKDDHHHHGLSGWAIFLIVVVVVVSLAAAVWLVLALMRRRQSGASNLTMPTPRPSGIAGWINDKFRSLKNRRTAAGAYEGAGGGTGYGGSGRRRGTALDPDEAWDSRVGNEADVYGPGGYYEEQELGLHPPTAYSGTGYGQPSPGFGASAGDERGRSRSRQRELDERYDEATGATSRSNPFGDDAERSNMSMRGVSPRPLDTNAAREHDGQGSGTSPTERRSMFREAV